MKYLKLFTSKFKWVFIANLYSSLSKFIILIVIAQFLTTTEVGLYTLALAVTAPITLLFNMKMKSVVITEETPRILMLRNIRFFSNIIALIMVIFISSIFYHEYIVVIMLIGIIKILDINSEFYQSLPNKNKDFHITSKLIVTKFTIVTFSFFLTIMLLGDLVLGLIVYIIVQILHLNVERNFFNKYLINDFYNSKTSYKKLLVFMIPLGLTQMLYSFGASIPKYILEYIGTIEQVGIFSAILYFITVVNMLISSVFQTLLPYAMEQYHSNYSKFNKLISKIIPPIVLVFCLTLYIPTYLWGELILDVVFGEVYGDHYKLLYILIVTILFNILGWLFDTTLLISRKIKMQPVFTLLNIILTSIVGWFLINYDVLIGATITTVIYSFINFLYKFLYYTKRN